MGRLLGASRAVLMHPYREGCLNLCLVISQAEICAAIIDEKEEKKFVKQKNYRLLYLLPLLAHLDVSSSPHPGPARTGLPQAGAPLPANKTIPGPDITSRPGHWS